MENKTYKKEKGLLNEDETFKLNATKLIDLIN